MTNGALRTGAMLLCKLWLAAAVVVAVPSAGAAEGSAPPPTATDQTVDTIHGVRIADPYRWLENSKDPAVQTWSDRQNLYTRDYLNGLAVHAKLKAELGRLIKATSPSFAALQVCGDHVFALYEDPKRQQPALVMLTAALDPKVRRTVIDPNALDPTGLTAIDWYVASPDGSKVAASLSKNGSEDGTLHVFDTTTGKEIEAPIPRVQYPTAGGSAAWSADGRAFWYTRYPGPEAPVSDQQFNMQVYFHKLGTAASGDALALGSRDGLERVSEVFLDNRSGLPVITAMVQRGDGNVWAMYSLQAGSPPVRLAGYADGLVYATIGPDGAIYGISRRHSSNGEVVRASSPLVAGALAAAATIVPAGAKAIVSGGAESFQPDLSFGKDRLYVRYIDGGPNSIRVFDLHGKDRGSLALPKIAGNAEIVSLANGDAIFDVTSYLRPRYYAAWRARSGRIEETAVRDTAPYSYEGYQVVREFAVSKDGTKVPVMIIRRDGVKLDGSNPVLLYGYGGYGINTSPRFLTPMIKVWLDGGGIYCDAVIRGGSEYGERWHQQGMLTRKQNVFDDYYAIAQHLIERGYTSSRKLALLGGSNGGLLMGAEITQHPQLARAVVSIAGVYDMIRSELDPNGAFNVTEYGSVKDAEQFKALIAYSPYHHVVKGTKYPAVLLMSGAHDGRVNPMQSRKFAAALQGATSSGLPVLLWTDANSGHGFGSSLDERIEEQADFMSFLVAQLAVHQSPTLQ
ncbi:MAG TPA: prolyl oligopeptidase family serine peptidase [Steroidobacteraceae bacterium]|nr:prolyl oligopeptidase family serine peptidase [Steroidobacteraceae bacterium]